MIQWIDIPGLFTILLLVLMGCVLLSRWKGKHIRLNLLGSLFFVNALLLFQFYASHLGLIPHRTFEWFYSVTRPSYLLLMPIFLLVTQSFCASSYRLTSRKWIHFLPYGLAVLYFFLVPSSNPLRSVIYRIMLYSQILIYVIWIILTISNFRQRIKEQYSTIHHIKLNWLIWLLTGYVILCFGNGLINLIDSMLPSTEKLSTMLFFFIIIINLAVAVVFLYYGMQQSRFPGIEHAEKYAGSKLTQMDFNAISKSLSAMMHLNHPYLDPELTLDKLADRLNISSKNLSQVINQKYQMNFYDFINSHRIDAFKRLAQVPGNEKKTILELLYDVGFNSKTTFNVAFKKHTGITPSQFKRHSD